MQIDQLLHGYNNGHHLIAGSVSLPLHDADMMSYLSDWSGYVNPIDKETSYITAYPLEESQSYVIAKSWYADEMSRPGCVWTHSLVIKLDSLGQYANFYELLKLFRRPEREGEDFMAYTKPIILKEEKLQGRREPLKGIDPTRFMFLCAFLLDMQKPAVYAVEKTSEDYIELCMRLIQNIPYGFLKGMAICSGSASARKFGKGFYNLQFVAGKGETLMEPYPDNVNKPTADVGFKFWMDSVLDGRNDMSQMLHLFSDDIGRDSTKFLATVNLLKLLDDKISGRGDDVGIGEILNHLEGGFKDKESGATVKKAFLRESVAKLFCDERQFIVELATTSKSRSFDYKAFDFSSRVEDYRKTHAIEEYVSLLVELSKADYLNDEGKMILSTALDGLTKDEIVVLLNQDWSLFKSIVTLNSQVLAEDFWLNLMPTQFVSLFSIFQRSVPAEFDAWEKLYKKLLSVDTFVADDILSEFVEHVEEYVAIAFDQWNQPNRVPINKIILKYCLKQRSRVIGWMGKQGMVNDDIRAAIKKHIEPDEQAVVRMGSAAWKAFVEGEMSGKVDANELVYVYVLAFNWRDFNALSYLKKVLPYIYESLSLETFSYSSWQRIERFTGSVPFWKSWDNCRKVLIGVRDYCKSMNLQDGDIENFTTNKKLNGELMELWRKR